jgi:hypothetical protein
MRRLGSERKAVKTAPCLTGHLKMVGNAANTF